MLLVLQAKLVGSVT